MWTCPLCPVEIPSVTAFQQHFLYNHFDQICEIKKPMKSYYFSDQRISEIAPTKAHNKASHDSGPVKPRVTTTFAPIETRPRLHFSCPELDCSKRFENLQGVRQHQEEQRDTGRHCLVSLSSTNRTACEACPKEFKDDAALEQHWNAEHCMIRLDSSSEESINIKRIFRDEWKKNLGRLDAIQEVFKIYNPAWRVTKYKLYRDSIDLKNRGSNGEWSKGNEKRMFHGTTLACELGRRRQGSKLCHQPNCSVCSIFRRGFKVTKASKDKFQRFGLGIYTTPTSSKSDEYITIRSDATRRAVLVCNVLVGKPYYSQENMRTLTAPPEGYNSVWGVPGKELNYDEVVVYDANAILPTFMLVYTVRSF